MVLSMWSWTEQLGLQGISGALEKVIAKKESEGNIGCGSP
jgi:hypothetical protein